MMNRPLSVMNLDLTEEESAALLRPAVIRESQLHPRLIESRAVDTPSDLLKLPLLRLIDGTGWTRWFQAAGVAHPVAHGPVLNRASMLIDAAADGQGVALARTTLAACDLIKWASRHPYRRVVGDTQHLLDR